MNSNLFDYNNPDSIFLTIMNFLVIALIGFIIISLLVYVLTSIGLYGMAKKRGLENAYLAWIPIGNLFLLETLVGEFSLFDYRITKWALYYILSILGVMVGGCILGFIPIIGSLIHIAVSLAIPVFFVIVHYHLFKKYRPDLAIIFTVLTALGLACIPIFMLRNSLPADTKN